MSSRLVTITVDGECLTFSLPEGKVGYLAVGDDGGVLQRHWFVVDKAQDVIVPWRPRPATMSSNASRVLLALDYVKVGNQRELLRLRPGMKRRELIAAVNELVALGFCLQAKSGRELKMWPTLAGQMRAQKLRDKGPTEE